MARPIPNKRKECKFCSKPGKVAGKYKNGQTKYVNICDSCSKFPYRRFKKEKCDFCGFVPVHSCQLDVDHKDGNKNNNSLENLQTLCANCHRLKTLLNKDWLSK